MPKGVFDHSHLRKSLAERFWAKVDKSGPIPEHRPDLGPCWIWLGSFRGKYGRCFVRLDPGRKTVKSDAHRVSYELNVGPIPEGKELDHLCRNRGCCNYAHVEPVTRAVNLQRSPLIGRTRKPVTHCDNGHPLAGGNVIVEKKTGYRRCRECRLKYQREYRKRVAA